MRRVSPSRILKTIQCPRAQAYRDVHGAPPDTVASAKGKDGHHRLEVWYRDGVMFDIADDMGSRVLRALAHLPGPDRRKFLRTEVELNLVRDGVEWIGYADLLETMALDARAIVHDYKTTSDPQYAETDESLPESVQFVFYAEATLERFRIFEEVAAQWTYIRTRGKKESWPVRTKFYTRAEIGQKFLALNKVAAIVARLPAQPSRLPRHYQACNDFGGCPYRPHCHPQPTAAESAVALFAKESKKMNLLEMLDAATEIESQVLPESTPTEPGDFFTPKEETSGNGPFANPIDTSAKDKGAKADELLGPTNGSIEHMIATPRVVLVDPIPHRDDCPVTHGASVDCVTGYECQTAPVSELVAALERGAIGPCEIIRETGPDGQPVVTAVPKRGRGRPRGSKGKAKPEEQTAPVVEGARPEGLTSPLAMPPQLPASLSDRIFTTVTMTELDEIKAPRRALSLYEVESIICRAIDSGRTNEQIRDLLALVKEALQP